MALNDVPYGYMLRQLPLKDRLRLQMQMETAPPSVGSPFSFDLPNFMAKRGHEPPPPAGEFIPGRGPANYLGTSVEARWADNLKRAGIAGAPQGIPPATGGSLIKTRELGPLTPEAGMAKAQQTVAARPASPPPPPGDRPAPQDPPNRGGGKLSGFALAGGFAGMGDANADMDWRTTPVQALTRALGGFSRGAFQALAMEGDQADRRETRDLRKQMMEMELGDRQAQRAQAVQGEEALADAMSGLAPNDQKTARLLMSVGDKEGLSRLLGVAGPEEQKRYEVGGSLVDATGNVIYQAPEDPAAAPEAKRYNVGGALVDENGKVVYQAPAGAASSTADWDMSGGLLFNTRTGEVKNSPVAPASGSKIISGKAAEELGMPGFVLEQTAGGRYEVLSKPEGAGTTVYDRDGNPIVQMGAGGAAPKAPSGYRWTDQTFNQMEPIPGGPAEAASSELAGKASMLPGSLEDVKAATDMLVDPKTGDVNRTAVISASPPIPFVGALPVGGGREVDSRLTGAIDTLIRARTGAAATESEMDRMTGMYMPRATDSDSVVKSKLDRLNRDLTVMQEQIARGKGGVENAVQVPAGAPPEAPGMAAVGEQLAQPSAPPQAGAVVDGYRFKGGNPNDPNAWEQVTP
jgi:hypothetical protein